MKDQLYLLRPGFTNVGLGPFYCNDSVPVEGLLSFFPQLRTLVDVHYLEFPRPRLTLVEALGEQHQSVPVLVVAPGRTVASEEVQLREAGAHRFIADERSIRNYLSTQYGLPQAG